MPLPDAPVIAAKEAVGAANSTLLSGICMGAAPAVSGKGGAAPGAERGANAPDCLPLRAGVHMDRTAVDAIARAILYEGYLLYPYRPSAVKNQRRWNFGVLSPEAWSQAQNGTDPCCLHTECLVEGSGETVIGVDARFLQLQQRRAGGRAGAGTDGLPALQPLEINGEARVPWEEAIERTVSLPACSLGMLMAEPMTTRFSFPPLRSVEAPTEGDGEHSGAIELQRQPLRGVVEVAAREVGAGIYRISVHIANLTPLPGDAHAATRGEALLRSMVSTHAVLGVEAGSFVSLLETPESWQELAAGCRNEGVWPVLAGEPGARNLMLASPIILYDYPRIAPESPGDLFDGTEIDEILSLRIRTLTEAEKAEIRDADERGRQLLERTEHLATEQLMKLHGKLRGPAASEEEKPEDGRE